MVLTIGATFALASLGAVFAVSVLMFIILGAGFLFFRATLSQKARYHMDNPYEQQVSTAFFLAISSTADAAVVTAVSVATVASQLINNLVVFLPAIITALIALPIALIVVEYHPEMAAFAANVWQCGAVPILYSGFHLLDIINALRLALDAAWGILRLVARFTRLFLRSLGIYILEMLGFKLLLIIVYVSEAIGKVGLALGTWISGPGSVVTGTFDTFAAFQTFFKIETILQAALDIACMRLDFLWAILLEWLSKDFTARFVAYVVAAAVELVFQIPLRCFTGRNTGTVPGVTSDYVFFPNFDGVFDKLSLAVEELGQFVNFEIYITVRELTGLFDPSLFVVGSPEEVVLASDWIGAVTSIARAAVEILRMWFHMYTILLTLLIQGIVFLLSLIWGPGTFIPVGPALYCDIREWRALIDPGGPVSLYYKDAHFWGHVYKAVDRLCAALDILSPVLCALAKPALLFVVDFSNAFGILPVCYIFAFLSPLIFFAWPLDLPFAGVRFILHLVDSEWRMFSPPVPPRTGAPVTFWIPAPALPPAPVSCAANPGYPGYVLPWLQHYIEDPDGFHLLIVLRLRQLGDGLDGIFAPVASGVGSFFKGVFEIYASTYDVIIQTLFHINVIIFETLTNKALFIARWRYPAFLDALDTYGAGLEAMLTYLDPLECTDAFAGSRIFCCLADLMHELFQVVRELGYQLMLIVTTTIVPPLAVPDATAAIDRLEEAIKSVFCVISNIVPPFVLRTGPMYTLKDAVRNLLNSFVGILVILLRRGNDLIHQIALLATTYAGGVQSCITGFGTLFQGFMTTTLQNIKVAFGDDLLVGVATFLDDLLLGGVPTLKPLAQAFVDILDALSTIVQEFAFAVLTRIFKVIATFIAMLFDGTVGFSTRISNFIAAVFNLILYLLLAFPSFIINLIFGILEAILPAPLGAIISSIGKLLITGFCTVIQTFTDVVTDVLNAFGAGLAKPDFCCSGGSCVPSVKRRYDTGMGYFDDAHDRATSYVKEHLTTLLNQGGKMRQSELSDRFQRYQRVLERFQEEKGRKKRATNALFQDIPSGDTSSLTPALDASTLLGPYVYANTSVAADEPATFRVSLEDAMQLITQMVDWDGASLCDRLVHSLNATGTKISQLPLMERLTIEDCVSKRTLGEIFSVMPYLTWFPKDGFYNPMRWLELSMDVMRDYTIYTQYLSDRGMPRDVVLSDTYRAAWAQKGLRVDHLTDDQYLTFMNWTYITYVRRNNGNTEVVEAVLGFTEAFRTSMLLQGVYYDNMSLVLHNVSSDPLQAWIDGSMSDERTLPSEIQQQHLLWTSFLSVIRFTTNLSMTFYNESVKRGLWDKTGAALVEVPGMLTRSVRWLFGGPDPAWTTAMKQRDEDNNRLGTFNMSISANHILSKRRSMGHPMGGASADDMTAAASSAADDGSVSLGDLIVSSLKNWWVTKREALSRHLFTANSVRAQRNRRILGHIWSELSGVWTTLRSPIVINTGHPPISIATTQRGHVTWNERTRVANMRNSALADRSAHPLWHLPARVATFATGNEVMLLNGTHVTELQICNASIVPFCLGCAVVDATIAEGFIAIDELASYYEPGGYFTSESMVRYNRTRDYIAAGANQTVCNGTGSSVIHWPSDMVILPDGRTFFDLFGGNNGLLGTVITGVSSVPSATLTWLWKSGVPREASMAHITATIIDGTRRFVDDITPAQVRAQTVSLASVPIINVTENRIFDYATSHATFDLTYVIFDIIPPLKPLLLALDAVGQFVTRMSLTYTFVFDPLTNSTTSVPVFDGSGEGSVIGYLWTQFIAADYTYTCDRRAMTLMQGVALFLLVTIALSIVLSLLVGRFSQGAASMILTLYIMLLPYIFFVVVYKYPVQNLFFLPLPLPPMCFVDDVVDALVCDIAQKCPAQFAMAAKTPYTEANCYSCPISNSTSLEWLHCKRDFDMIDMIDVLSGILRWTVPSFMSLIVGFAKMIPFVGSTIATRLNKYSTLDLGDKATLDNLVYCLGVIGGSSFPTLVLLFVSIASIVMAVVYLMTSIPVSYTRALSSWANLAFVLDMSITMGTVYFVSPGEMLAFQDMLRKGANAGGVSNDSVYAKGSEFDRKRRAARARRRQERLLAEEAEATPPAPTSISRKPDDTTPWSSFWHTLHSRAQQWMDRTGIDYYWQATRGASRQTLKLAARSQAQRLGINQAVVHQARVLARAENEQRRYMKDVFAGF